MADVKYSVTATKHPALSEVLDLDGIVSAGTSLPESYDVVNDTGGEWDGYIFKVYGNGFSYREDHRPSAGGIANKAEILAPDRTVIATVTVGSTGFALDTFDLVFGPLVSSEFIALDMWLGRLDTVTGTDQADRLFQFGVGIDPLDVLIGNGGNDFLAVRQTGGTDGAKHIVHGHSGAGTATTGEVDRLGVFPGAYFFAELTDIDEVEFVEQPGLKGGSIFISLDQIGPGLVAPNLKVIGSTGDDANVINVVGDADDVVDLSQWTFTNWTRSTQYVSIFLDGAETKLTIVGTSGADHMTGGKLGDSLNGTVGDDLLDGGAGADKLVGGEGIDTFAFVEGIGKLSRTVDDDLLRKAKADKIADFDHGDDTIALSKKVFKALGKTIEKGEFLKVKGKKGAKDGHDRLIYNKDTGGLYFDKDGDGKAAAKLFATLKGSPNDVSVDDFVLVA